MSFFNSPNMRMACFTAKAMVANKQLWEPQMCTFVHSKYSIFYYAFSNKENEKNRSVFARAVVAKALLFTANLIFTLVAKNRKVYFN